MNYYVIMSCSSSSKLLQYWKYVSKMWKNYNYIPILGIVGDVSKEKLTELNHYGKIYHFNNVNNISENILSEITKYYICNFLEEDSSVIFVKLNLLLLQKDWIASLVHRIDNNILIPWPELRSEYLMGKNNLFMKLFNKKKLDYNSWLELLVINSFNFTDKEGTLISKKFSDDGFLFNMINNMEEDIKIQLIERDDIYFTNSNSYGMTKRTDWENWDRLSLDSDIDLIGPIDLESNLDKLKIVFQIIGL